MMIQSPPFALRLAHDANDLLAAQRLRYRVFVQELGGDGPLVDHDLGLERDQFDDAFDHLLLIDPLRPEGEHVVGVYRLLQMEGARRLGQFYSETEYDLTPLLASGRRLLELGRSCLHPAYRGGVAMYHLWHGLADYVTQHGIEVLFGVASFHGADPQALAQPLSYLHQHHLAPAELRVRSRVYQPMDLLPANEIDRRQAMLQTPALIKAYLRLGGTVGEGAFVDAAFNTVDVCLVMDTARMNDRQKHLYTKPGRSL
jgi:L-ornithine Nalpha-acyltransferase